jgi:RNA-directed DNA polymerase
MAKPRPKLPLEREKARAIEPLNLLSEGDLAKRLGIPREKLRSIASEADSHYNPFFQIKPPRPFAIKPSKIKVREIDRPLDPLLEVQKQIYFTLLRDLHVPEYICGGVKGRSVLDNVAHHQNEPTIVSLDIKSWFPSINAHQIYFVWRVVLKCSHKVARLLTKLTTFNGHLPQGAPTSTTLANFVLYSIDAQIRKAAALHGVNYSSWVDDIAFSGSNARKLIPIAVSIFKSEGFRISRSKLKVMGRSKQQEVNGVIAGIRPSISKKKRDQIRAALHHLSVGDIRDEDTARYIATQKGRIAYLASVNPDQARRFEIELARILEKCATTT